MGKRLIIEHVEGGFIITAYKQGWQVPEMHAVCRTLDELVGAVLTVYAPPEHEYRIARVDTHAEQEG